MEYLTNEINSTIVLLKKEYAKTSANNFAVCLSSHQTC